MSARTSLARFCRPLGVALLALPFALACSDSSGGGGSPDGGNGNGNGNGGPNLGNPCDYMSDCPMDKCVDGVCVEATQCMGSLGCDDEVYTTCHEQRCIPICFTDLDCPEEGYCYQGVCRPQTFGIDAPEPNAGATERQPLKVGVATAYMETPVGVSMAGFGFRLGPQTPYNRALGGSTGMYDRPATRALAFDDGVERVVLLRLPTCWSTDFLISLTAQKLAERIGENYLTRLVTSSNHSHSYPARFWRVLPDQPSLGTFGQGTFSAEISNRIAENMADAAEAAIADLAPATLGWTWLESFDPDNQITSDRRSANAPFKDDRLVYMEVRRDDQPLAVLVNFGIHGTHMENSRITGDVGFGIENAIERELEAQTDADVSVFFLNGNGGDISPRGDNLGHPNYGKVQVVGWRTWKVIEALRADLEFKSDITMGLSHARFVIDYDTLGYVNGEFFDRGVLGGGENRPFRMGSFQCVNDEDDDLSTRHEDGALGCIFAVDYINHAPVAQFMKTRVSAWSFGDELIFVTLPGEPVSRLGVDLADAIKTQFGYEHAAILGYAQDHQLYLTPEDDWWQGGYEAAQSLWGWRMGQYASAQALAMVGRHKEGERGEPATRLKPSFWPDVDLNEAVPPTTTPSGLAGSFTTPPPENIERFEVVEVVWQGGHPGVDLPSMTLQRQTEDDSWVDVTRPGGEIYTDAGVEVLLEYQGNYESDHTWSLRWEEGERFPAGTYRMRIEGEFWDGSAKMPYEAGLENSFTFGATTQMYVDIEVSSGDAEGDWTVTGRVGYPAGPRFDPQDSGLEARPLWHRMRSPLAPGWVPTPLNIELEHSITARLLAADGSELGTAEGSELTMLSTNFDVEKFRLDGDRNPVARTFRDVATSAFELDIAEQADAATLEIEVEDAFGNSGKASLSLADAPAQ